MRKLTLDLDALRVESFHTDTMDAGTAHGFRSAWSDNSICPGTTTTGTRPPI